MSRSSTPKTPKATTRPAAPAATTTAVRNTAIPKAAPVAVPRSVSHDAVAKRAYEISQSPQRGSDHDNWVRAERELRGL